MPAQLKRRLTVFLVAVGLIALAFFLHWWFIGRHVESTDNAYVQGEITRVASQLGARVEEVLVRDNQHVDKGQLLVRLEDADFKLAVERAQAALATREAELAQARSKLVPSPLNSFSATVRVEPSGWCQPARWMTPEAPSPIKPSRLSSLQSSAAMPLSASAGRRHNGLPA